VKERDIEDNRVVEVSERFIPAKICQLIK
jgi:hypothetical protein